MSRASGRCASMIAVSSPGWVEAAATTGRAADAFLSRELGRIGRRRRHVELQVAGGRHARCAEVPNRSASAAECARHRSNRAEQRRDRPGNSRQRLNERSDSRPLTRIIGMLRSAPT